MASFIEVDELVVWHLRETTLVFSRRLVYSVQSIGLYLINVRCHLLQAPLMSVAINVSTIDFRCH